MNNTKQWCDALISRLFEAENRRLDHIVEELVDANNALLGKPHHGFTFMGSKYIPMKFDALRKALARQPVPTLSFMLQDQGRALEKDVQSIQFDKDRIRQVFVTLLTNCNDLQDIRDSLPDCVVSLVPELQVLNRKMAHPTWAIKSDRFALKAYENMLERIEMYAVSRLLY